MRIVITFPRGVDSHALYDDLSCFNMNVTEIDTVVYVHRNDITATEISQVLVVCDKYGCYDMSLTK
jgi:hypothetical protein